MVEIGVFGLLNFDDESIMDKSIQDIALFIGIVSIICNILVALSYFSKKVRAHPSFLLFMIAICECSATIYMVYGSHDVNKIIQDLELNKALYHLTFYIDLRNNNKYSILDRNTELLCESNNMLMNFFSLGSIIFNICLCIDLLMSLSLPFAPPQKRNKFFFGAMVTISFLTVFILREPLKLPCRTEKSGSDHFQSRSTPATAFFLLVFIVVGLVSVIYAWKRVNNTYGEQGKNYFRKHFAYVTCFIFIWSFYGISNGIFTLCYLTVDGSSKKTNAEIYSECIKKYPKEATLLVLLTNVRIYLTVDWNNIRIIRRNCIRSY